MREVLNNYAEKLKRNIESISKESKESIRAIIENNSMQVNEGLRNNKELIDFLKDNLSVKELTPAIINNINRTFVSSIEMSEEVIDKIIDAHTRQIDLTIEFNTSLIDIIKEEGFADKEQADKLLKLAEQNFISSIQLSNGNMKDIIFAYNKHINVALNFNKKLVEDINAQIDGLLKLQNKNLNSFYNLISDWVKQNESAKYNYL
jgi:hypothetical protein